MATKTKRISSANEVIEYRPKPTLSIDSKDVKSVRDMKVGETHQFVVTAKVLAVNAGDEWGSSDGEDDYRTTRARLRITKISEK